MNVRTKGFCLALLRCGEIKLIAEKREYAISDLIANIARTKRRRTKSFSTHVYNTSNNTSTKLQLQWIKLHIEIVNLKPVTPTTILVPGLHETNFNTQCYNDAIGLTIRTLARA